MKKGADRSYGIQRATPERLRLSDLANVDTKQYEYAVVNSPYSFDSAHDDVIAFDLDDAAHAAKIEQARLLASVIPDADDLLRRAANDACAGFVTPSHV